MEPSAAAAGLKVSAARLASVSREVRNVCLELPRLQPLVHGMPDELEAMELRLYELARWLYSLASTQVQGAAISTGRPRSAQR